MKSVSLLLALASLATTALGQGQFVFNNRVPPEINVRFQLASELGTTSSSISGNAYTVQLLGGLSGTPVALLMPLGSTDFRTGAAAGYVNPITVTVPGVSGGKSIDVVLRLFAGSSAQGTPLMFLGPYQVTVQEAPNIPPNLPLGTSPFLPCLDCPEPTPTWLMLGGLAGLLLTLARGRPTVCLITSPAVQNPPLLGQRVQR